MDKVYCYVMESQQNKKIIKIGVSKQPEKRAKQVGKSYRYAKYAPYTVVRKFHFTSKKEALRLESVLLQTVGIDEDNYYDSFVGGCPELRYGGVKSVDAILSASNIEKIWACFWASKNSFIGCISINDAVSLEINTLLKPQLIAEIHEFKNNQTEAFNLLKCLAAPVHSGTMLASDYDKVMKTAKEKASKEAEKQLTEEIKQHGYNAKKIEALAEYLAVDLAVKIIQEEILPTYKTRLKEIQNVSIALSQLTSLKPK